MSAVIWILGAIVLVCAVFAAALCLVKGGTIADPDLPDTEPSD